MRISDWSSDVCSSDLGELRTTGAVRRLEEAALADDEAMVLRAGLESAGLRQERRATRLRPEALAWEWPGNDALVLGFSLPPGTYATTVLAELGPIHDSQGGKRPFVGNADRQGVGVGKSGVVRVESGGGRLMK